MKIIDISLPISPTMLEYPGITPPRFEPTLSASGKSFLTTITHSSHAGTHIDAPSHVMRSAPSVDAFALERFYGPCRVLDMTACSEAVDATVLRSKNIQTGERILIKTQNSARGYAKFHDGWVGVSSDGAAYLATCGVALVGIDWLGIKAKGALDNVAHTALLEKDIPILEGLDLAAVEEGGYILAAFPLAYQGVDGALTRAVLMVEDDTRTR